VSADAQAAKLIGHPAPVYPAEARAARISGHVILNAIIDRDGGVRDLSTVSGDAVLVPAAIEAVMSMARRPRW
jgi:periplasmic protein TonB